MTSGNYKCETELSITDIEEVEIEQIACGSYFVDIKDILNKEIVKEEATDVKTCSVYGNEQNANINQFGAVPILKRGIVEGDPTETKAFDFCENIDHNGFAGALAKSKVKKEDEDHPECSDNPLANDAEWKLETFKREDDINIIYKDVKHGICEEKSSEKKENESCMNSVAEILTETKIEPYSSYELPICSELWPQQNIEEDETAVESYNDTRKEPTITLNSRNCQKFQEFSHHSECTNDSITNDAEWKPETLKREDDINIIYEDVKHGICEEKWSKKKENESYTNSVAKISTITKIEPNFSNQLPIYSKTWPQQNLEEDETAVESYNDTRKEPHRKFSKQISFQPKQELKEKINIEEKPFECKFCLKKFAVKSTLVRHEKAHTSKKPFQCKICSMSFAVEKILSKHETIHREKRPNQCRICLKSFTRKQHLDIHERIHTGEKPFQCNICLKSFAYRITLLTHEMIHTGEKPFQCKFCSISFNHKGNLSKHARIHSGEKPYQCKICSKLFTRQEHVTVHLRIHSGEKPFQCKTCPKSFSDRNSSLRHERTHTGEKPFQCKICLKSFVEKTNLLRHELIHTGKKTFQCKFCPKSFKSKGNFTKHTKIHLGEKAS